MKIGFSFLIVLCYLVLSLAYLPSWTPTYDMSESTIFMPCNYSGFFDPVFSAQFGIADFDWSNGKMDWANQKPMDCEERLLKQAAMVKQHNPKTKVWVYRNLVKALPWYTSVQKKISDPAYSGWFLSFKQKGPYHVPTCTGNVCSNLYHDQDQTPHHPSECIGECDCAGVPCGEYLFDHRNDTLRNFLINEFVLGPTGLGNKDVSGFYFDDGWTNYSAPIKPWQPKEGYCDHSPIGGATEEDLYCSEDMGLTQADTTAITEGWRTTMDAVHAAVRSAGAWSWDQFHSTSTPNKTSCTNFFRSACAPGNPSYKSVALMQSLSWVEGKLPNLAQDLATFLLIRGDYAWLGYSWVGCCSGSKPPGNNDYAYVYPPEFKVDYGTPVGQCLETGTGTNVFKRQWTKAVVTMDCQTWQATIDMKEDDEIVLWS